MNYKTTFFVFLGKAEPAAINSDPKGPEYDRFTLEWNARSLTPVTRFKIQYKGLQDDTWSEEEVEAYPVPNAENIYTGTFMVQDLAPASVYMARVSSHNLYGYSEPGQVFQFATRGGGKKTLSLNLKVLKNLIFLNFGAGIIATKIHSLKLNGQHGQGAVVHLS